MSSLKSNCKRFVSVISHSTPRLNSNEKEIEIEEDDVYSPQNRHCKKSPLPPEAGGGKTSPAMIIVVIVTMAGSLFQGKR